MFGTLALMTGRGRLLTLLGLAAILVGLASLPGGELNAAPSLSGALIRADQVASNVKLEVWTSPEAGIPGDQIILNLILSIIGPVSSTPEVVVEIPGTLEVDIRNLPAGSSYIVQERRLVWQPMLDSSAETLPVAIPLKIASVNLNSPEQNIAVFLRDGQVEIKHIATFWAGLPPQASIILSPPQAAVGQVLQLVGEVSGPGPIIQKWDLGDGRSVSVNDPEVVYSTPGIYEITLQASNPLSSTVTKAILTVTANPIASFSTGRGAVMAGEAIAFLNQSGGQEPLQYLWEFGDGSISTEKNPIHSFSEAGTYQVHLTISNDLGQSDSFRQVAVGSPPVADIVADPSPTAGRRFELQAFHDGSITDVRWDMGDGHYYEGVSINHVYWSAGDYLVVATFSNDFGDSVVQKWVTVGPGSLYLFLPTIILSGDAVPAPEPAETEQLIDGQFKPEESEEAAKLAELVVPEDISPAEKLYAYINEARRINNLPPLEMLYELNVAAQTHTDDMAALGYTGHQGSDGSSPALRIQRAAYIGGYAGEATAWGMQNAIEPVQFWLTSPNHRVILLNPSARQVGVGYSQNYNAPSVWYWTAEFASPDLPRIVVEDPLEVDDNSGVPAVTPVGQQPVQSQAIQLLGPPQNSDFTLTAETELIFTWNWANPLSPNQRFAIYLNSQGRIYQIGVVRDGQSGTQYQYKVQASNIAVVQGDHHWLIRLEDSELGEVLAESDYWPISFRQADSE